MRADNAMAESVQASNGEHIQMYAKTSILCEERTGCYCAVPLTGARLGGLASRISECSRCQAEYQDSGFTDKETMDLTDTNKTSERRLFNGDSTLHQERTFPLSF